MRRFSVSRLIGVIGMTAMTVTFTTGATFASSAAAVSTARHAEVQVQLRDGTGNLHVAANETASPGSRRYTVASGDTLSVIAAREYSRAACWPGIYRASKEVIGSNPNIILPGQVLTVPDACDSTPVPDYVTTATVEPEPGLHGEGAGTAAYSPQPPPAVASGNLSFDGLESLWEAAGGPSWAAYQAAEVAWCESGGQQYAYNPSGASGYWQILGQVVPGDIFDPMVNAENAVSKFEASGDTFAQWVCQP